MAKPYGIERVVLKWKGDEGEAPDDTRYAIFSEHVRGEPRFYYLQAAYPETQGSEGTIPAWTPLHLETNPSYPTKGQLRGLAQRDATRREAERQGAL